MAQEHPADSSREQWLRTELSELQDDIKAMRKRQSYQALVAARRLALKYKNELDEINKEEEDAEMPGSLDEVVALMMSFPDAAFSHPDVIARVRRCS